MVGLKTHSKLSLVIREEEDGSSLLPHRHRQHNPKTAALYTDLAFSVAGLISAPTSWTSQYLTGYSRQIGTAARRFVNMRQKFLELIDTEIANVCAGLRGSAKCGMEDPVLARKLYEASQAGVQIDLIVRGNCRVRPGLPGVSENIRVISIIGRFLEHPRIWYFENNGSPRYYIGSADWMKRNLSNRVEAIVPIEDPRKVQITTYFGLSKTTARFKCCLTVVTAAAAWATATLPSTPGSQQALMRHAADHLTTAHDI